MTRQALPIAALLVAASVAHAKPQKVGAPPEASNMKLLGWSDLQARSAYQPTIHQQGGRCHRHVTKDELPERGSRARHQWRSYRSGRGCKWQNESWW